MSRIIHVNLDLCLEDLEPDFIWIIAEQTLDPAVLDAIVDHAIETEYPDGCENFYEQLYMNKVCENPALSKESIIKLIRYNNKDIREMISQRPDLDRDLSEMLLTEDD
jgi:hypothetical protein